MHPTPGAEAEEAPGDARNAQDGKDEEYDHYNHDEDLSGMIEYPEESVVLGLMVELRALCREIVAFHAEVYHENDKESDVHERNEGEDVPPEHLVFFNADQKGQCEEERSPRPPRRRDDMFVVFFHRVDYTKTTHRKGGLFCLWTYGESNPGIAHAMRVLYH